MIPLVDVAASFAADGGRTAAEIERARLRVGGQLGIVAHVAVTLDHEPLRSWREVLEENDARAALHRRHGSACHWMAALRGDEPEGAMAELARCVALGAIGVDLLPPTEERAMAESLLFGAAERHSLTVRSRDAALVAALAARHPATHFLLAQLGDGGDWPTALEAVAALANVSVDISGEVAERGMLDAVVARAGASRVLWGSGGAMETGLAHLGALDVMRLSVRDRKDIRFRNAFRRIALATNASRERSA